MKILVFGKTGQVATELRRQAECISLDRNQADLRDPSTCALAIKSILPDVVINAAAFTAVDEAEDQAEIAHTINGIAPSVMAVQAAALNIPFLHISTDYVFDGSGQKPWRPSSITAPINSYGRSKRQGEVGIIAAKGRYAILRTSWVFSAHGKNFVKTMASLAQKHKKLTIVDDQFGGPTAAADIASALLNMAARFHAGTGKSGVYHYCGAPCVSWNCFAEEIFDQSNQKVKVDGIASKNYPTQALRPLNSRLDCRDLEQDYGIKQPSWRSALSDVLTEMEILQ